MQKWVHKSFRNEEQLRLALLSPPYTVCYCRVELKDLSYEELVSKLVPVNCVNVSNKKNYIILGNFSEIELTDDILLNRLLVLQNLEKEHLKNLSDYLRIKPRLCRVYNGNFKEKAHIRKIIDTQDKSFICDSGNYWDHAEMLSDDEIKEFLNEKLIS